ncbi:hypothetical protein PM082_008695 [Marasmius tenuissimus]|nr:hypothetical protein PM082_008695 [Marasmius tenuissimus]
MACPGPPRSRLRRKNATGSSDLWNEDNLVQGRDSGRLCKSTALLRIVGKLGLPPSPSLLPTTSGKKEVAMLVKAPSKRVIQPGNYTLWSRPNIQRLEWNLLEKLQRYQLQNVVAFMSSFRVPAGMGYIKNWGSWVQRHDGDLENMCSPSQKGRFDPRLGLD